MALLDLFGEYIIGLDFYNFFLYAESFVESNDLGILFEVLKMVC